MHFLILVWISRQTKTSLWDTRRWSRGFSELEMKPLLDQTVDDTIPLLRWILLLYWRIFWGMNFPIFSPKMKTAQIPWLPFPFSGSELLFVSGEFGHEEIENRTAWLPFFNKKEWKLGILSRHKVAESIGKSFCVCDNACRITLNSNFQIYWRLSRFSIESRF